MNFDITSLLRALAGGQTNVAPTLAASNLAGMVGQLAAAQPLVQQAAGNISALQQPPVAATVASASNPVVDLASQTPQEQPLASRAAALNQANAQLPQNQQAPQPNPTPQASQTPQATSAQQAPAQSSVGNPIAQQPDIPSGLGGGLTPAQAQVGAQTAGTPAERGWWDQVMLNLTGSGLQDQALRDWQNNMGASTMLATLGHAIGGDDTFGGRLGKGVEQFGQGAIAGKNAEQSEASLYNLLNRMAGATAKAPVAQTTTTTTSTSTPEGGSQSYGKFQGTPGTSRLAEDIIRQMGI